MTPFDLIYLRMLTGSIKDWPKLFSQAYQLRSFLPYRNPFPSISTPF